MARWLEEDGGRETNLMTGFSKSVEMEARGRLKKFGKQMCWVIGKGLRSYVPTVP